MKVRLTLERIAIQNFKGIRELALDFGGKSAAITGCNGTGKTSIVDAFMWVLFNQFVKCHNQVIVLPVAQYVPVAPLHRAVQQATATPVAD